MALIFCLLLFILIFVGIYFDASRKINLTHKGIMLIYLIFVPHIVVLIYLLINYIRAIESPRLWHYSIIIEIIFFFTFLWIKVNLFPNLTKHPTSHRIKVLLGGRRLVRYGLYTIIVQIIVYSFTRAPLQQVKIPPHILVIDIIVVLLSITILHVNGMIRILVTSKRLNLIKKSILASVMFIPPINIFAILYVSQVAKSEYEHECFKVVSQNLQIDSAVCKTKYPLVLIHGVGFRDFKYINYWGRIPKELMRNGATVYYGNQEAWGTIEYNAQDIKDKILDIRQQTGCEKVNIIAHSKGGLDARYMISSLNMGEYVASLTMISTPHKGSELIDLIYKIPKKLFRLIGRGIDRYFRLLGDKNPDFFTASKQLSTFHAEKFNKEVFDHAEVYYQSYTTLMNHMFSDYFLTIPYLIMKLTKGESDGLITVESAKWGAFKGVLRNKHSRGISHGDIIDLRKDDYKGFDVREKYVEIVSELKNYGY